MSGISLSQRTDASFSKGLEKNNRKTDGKVHKKEVNQMTGSFCLNRVQITTELARAQLW
jgi:hypothetical protein